MEIRNLTRERVQSAQLRKLAKTVLSQEKKGKNELSLLFVGEAAMRKLNKAWRGKDKAANVLAFPGEELALGEIVLCPPVIRRGAVKYGILYQDAVRFMFVHGLLHLLGYDHENPREEKIMTKKEQRYLSAS